MIYAKSIDSITIHLLPRTDEMNSRYKNPDNDPRGPWQSGDLVASGERSNGHFWIVSPKTGKKFDVPQGKHWVYSQENLIKMVEDNQVWFGVDGNSFPRKKRFLTEVQDGRTPNTLWLAEEVGHNQTATREVKLLFDDSKYFDFPKPITYLEQFVRIFASDNCIVLDFFSGSATTAHAVMQLNAENGGHRKFIMVQLPELCDEKSEAFKAGYKNICEIGKERIRRAGKKILEDLKRQEFSRKGKIAVSQSFLSGEKIKERPGYIENPKIIEIEDTWRHPRTDEEYKSITKSLDIGFRCLRLDESNMQHVYYTPDMVEQQNLFSQVDNVKPDRTPEDLLFQVMLDLGILLSSSIETKEIAGKKVFNVADGFLLACFDHDITDETVKAIAQMKPHYAVFRDSSMANDSVAANFEQMFKAYSPDTVRKVL